MKKRIAAALLALVLCLAALPGAAFARETDYFLPLPPAFDYNELHLDGSCIAEMDAACAVALALLTESDKHVAIMEAWDRLSALQVEIDLQFTLTTIRYYQDPVTYGSTYASFVSGRNSALKTMRTTQQTMLSDAAYGDMLKLYAGFAQAAAIMAEDTPSEELLSLLRQENELEIRYQTAAEETVSCVVDGRTWTPETALSAYRAAPAAGQPYLDIYYRLYAQRNETLGQIFLQLVSIRKQIAQLNGYDDYAAYAYDTQYVRDYSLSDAAAFRASVRQQLPALYRSLVLAVRRGVFANGSEYGALDQEALLDAVAPYLAPISDELSESFSYMRDCHLVDLRFSQTNADVTFTVSLPKYNTGYVNCRRQGTDRDLFDTVHEFGHFNAFSRYARSSCYDTLEVHSQGLEMLFLNYADSLFGSRAKQQSGYELCRMLHSVMAGCMYDELQLFAYTTPDLTLDALNRKSAELSAQYALPSIGPAGVDYSWIDISHNFDSPMYYISYATSAVAALQIWLRSRTAGPEEAADLYLSFVHNSVIVPGFRNLVLATGMDDPFAAGTIEAFTQQLSRSIYGGLCCVPYQDTQGSWAEGDIVLLYLLDILNGTSDTTFSPDRTLTRAMAVTALYRAVNKPSSSVDAASVFDDVPADTWYSEAVGWAIEAGVTDGTSETTFSPMKPVTCQEFAAMLYRQRFGPGFDYSDEPAPEGAAGWAADALNWSRDEAVFRGETEPPAPTAELSRAEFAAAIVGAIYD